MEAEREEARNNEEKSQKTMSFLEHLDELRSRLIRIVIGVIVGFLASYAFSKHIFRVLMKPLIDVIGDERFLIFTGPAEAFITYLKVSLLAGIFVSCPYVLYQIWKFIAPGLYRRERRLVVPFVIAASIFFIGGAAFGYLVVFPYGFQFLIKGFESGQLLAQIKIGEYLSFATKLLLAFGITFELPIFIFFLARLGLVNAGFLWSKFKYAVLVIVASSAILTPPDVFTQIALSVPLVSLYLASIGVAKLFGKRRPSEEEDGDKDSPEDEDPAEQEHPRG